jgi:hypothetical protein
VHFLRRKPKLQEGLRNLTKQEELRMCSGRIMTDAANDVWNG